MLFDPDAGRTTEEIIFYKWNHEWGDELKSELMQIAEKFGCSWDGCRDGLHSGGG